MAEDEEPIPEPKSEWHGLAFITSGRAKAVWQVAHEYGKKTMKEFWTYAREEGWDYYDVLDIASP